MTAGRVNPWLTQAVEETQRANLEANVPNVRSDGADFAPQARLRSDQLGG
jgi:hypothetical protein